MVKTDDDQRAVEAQIEWVLNHAGMSDWLKMAIATARERDPIELMNDLEILTVVLRQRCAILHRTRN